MKLYDLEREVQRYKRGPLDQEAYQGDMNSIHTDAVTDVVNHYSVTITNAILGVHPQNLLQLKNIDCLDKRG